MELKKWMALAVSSAAIVAVAGCGGGNSAPAKSGAASGAGTHFCISRHSFGSRNNGSARTRYAHRGQYGFPDFVYSSRRATGFSR